MSLEDKFNAAVSVIRGLPKSGSYQPSNELMLRFYSFYKQATIGPCNQQKPGFWDVINRKLPEPYVRCSQTTDKRDNNGPVSHQAFNLSRAKWESWNKLGNMSKEEAMQGYVDELRKIVETMSYNSDVASFLSVDSDDSGFPSTYLELVAGDVIARVTSHQNSPVESNSASGASSPVRSGSPHPRSGHDSDEEFIDTLDSDPEIPPSIQRNLPRLSNGHAHQITSQPAHVKVLEQLPATLARLEADVAALRRAVEDDRRSFNAVSSGWEWWPHVTLAFAVVWPFIAYRIASRNDRRPT